MIVYGETSWDPVSVEADAVPRKGDSIRLIEGHPDLGDLFLEETVDEVCWWQADETMRLEPTVTVELTEREWDLHPPTPPELHWP